MSKSCQRYLERDVRWERRNDNVILSTIFPSAFLFSMSPLSWVIALRHYRGDHWRLQQRGFITFTGINLLLTMLLVTLPNCCVELEVLDYLLRKLYWMCLLLQWWVSSCLGRCFAVDLQTDSLVVKCLTKEKPLVTVLVQTLILGLKSWWRVLK